MAAVWTFLVANWTQILVILVAVDGALIGIFPKTPIFGTIGGWLAGAPKSL